MKRIFIIATSILMAIQAMALDFVPKAGLTWQVFAGLNVSNMSNYSEAWDISAYDAKCGANFGVRGEYMLPNAYGVYASFGANWSQKGARKAFDIIGDGHKDDNIVQAHFLEIPVRVGYRYNFDANWGVFGEVGPYIAMGITGKNKVKPYDDKLADTHTMTFGKMNYYEYDPVAGVYNDKNIKALQRFDCGMGFRVGAEFHNQYSVSLGYDWSFTDAWKDDFRRLYSDNELKENNNPNARLSKLKHHNFAVSFGFRF